MRLSSAVPIDLEKLEAFCRKWGIRELALLGSAVRDDDGPDRDLDFLVTFAADTTWGLLDHAAMERELSALAGRPVDLVSRRAVERSHNWIRRQAILASARVLHAA